VNTGGNLLFYQKSNTPLRFDFKSTVIALCPQIGIVLLL